MNAKKLLGSSRLKYIPITRVETGIGCSMFHSITAMKEYERFSNEEIRIEDYNASEGLFGSTIAKIAGLLCRETQLKPKPSDFGNLYQQAVKATSNEWKLSMQQSAEETQHERGELSLSNIEKFEYSNTEFHIPSPPEATMSVVREKVGKTNLKLSFDDSERHDAQVVPEEVRSTYKYYSVEGYQPRYRPQRRRLSNTSSAQVTDTSFECQPIFEQEIQHRRRICGRAVLSQWHYSSQFSLQPKNVELQTRLRSENKKNLKNSPSPLLDLLSDEECTQRPAPKTNPKKYQTRKRMKDLKENRKP